MFMQVFSLLSVKRVILLLFKKGNKQTLGNNRLVLLLPFCGKILERLMLHEIFKFFIENELISSNQFGSKPGDSSVYTLVAITREIYKSFYKAFVRPHLGFGNILYNQDFNLSFQQN